MTLSRFLRDYLYIPLGGNRKGSMLRYVNLFVTMTLGGLWHGAAWTFVFWGFLHGVYLSVNHLWRASCGRWRVAAQIDALPGMSALYWFLTFAAVMLAWCFFRAGDFVTGCRVVTSLLLLDHTAAPAFGVYEATVIVAAVAWVLLLPNSQQIVAFLANRRGIWLVMDGAGAGLVFICSLFFLVANQHENFIYFRF
jgi:D-alanyl-lipoteichoic acid acyltransferase DltB (MBOAT superfamily)